MSFELHYKIDDASLEGDEFAIGSGECDMRMPEFSTLGVSTDLTDERLFFVCDVVKPVGY